MTRIFWMHRIGSPVHRVFAIALLMVGVVAGLGCEPTQDSATSQPTSRPIAAKPITRTAEKGPMRVTITADRDEVLMAEPVKLTVHVEVEQGVQAGVAKIEGVLGDFEVKSTSELTPDCPQYTNCAEWEYVLEA
ncbi:MAG: hypothetical protein IPK83_21035 [Planctomycetes bacterium]|nr:hypothetical protein [Planctomycetota bacterium]